jgi:hypothetical protein
LINKMLKIYILCNNTDHDDDEIWFVTP